MAFVTSADRDLADYAEQLFELYWKNAAVFMTLPKPDRDQVMQDYNDIYNHLLSREDE